MIRLLSGRCHIRSKECKGSDSSWNQGQLLVFMCFCVCVKQALDSGEGLWRDQKKLGSVLRSLLPHSPAKGDKARLCLGKMDLRDKCLIKSQLGSGNEGGRVRGGVKNKGAGTCPEQTAPAYLSCCVCILGLSLKISTVTLVQTQNRLIWGNVFMFLSDHDAKHGPPSRPYPRPHPGPLLTSHTWEAEELIH